MTVQTVPPPPLVVSQAALALGILVELLYGPAAFRQGCQPLQGHLCTQRAVVGSWPACPTPRSTDGQPPGNPHRSLALLGKGGVVEHQDATFRTSRTQGPHAGA